MPFDGFLPSAPRGDPASSSIFTGGGGGTPLPTNIDCTVAQATWEGFPSAIGAGITINCAVAPATWQGFPCTVIAATHITCGVAAGTWVGYPVTFGVIAVGSGLVTCTISYAGTESTIPAYDIGDVVRVIGTFTDSVTGAPVVPAALSFRLRLPSGAINTSIVPTLDSTGVYHVDISASLGGVWRLTWLATGVAEDGEFVVSSSLSDAT